MYMKKITSSFLVFCFFMSSMIAANAAIPTVAKESLMIKTKKELRREHRLERQERRINHLLDQLGKRIQEKSPDKATRIQALNKMLLYGLIALLAGIVVGLIFGILGYLLSVVGIVLIIIGLLQMASVI